MLVHPHSFFEWRNSQVTQLLLKELEEMKRSINAASVTWDCVYKPELLAGNLGRLELIDYITNLKREDLEVDESEST